MKKRIYSLDVLRGFDMLILLYGSTLAWAMVDVPWWPRPILTQFSHPWGVFTLFDIVQPLFAVVCGASVPLALARRLEANGRPGGVYWRHVFGRFAMLFFFGAICGGLLTLDVQRAPYFGNTLQLLGFGYLFTAVCYAYVPRKWWLTICGGLVVAWGVALALGGDMTQTGNLSMKIERTMTAIFAPSRVLKGFNTTWGTVPMFCSLTLLGAYVMGFMRDASRSDRRRANTLIIAGLALMVLGIAVHFVQPEIKQLYTPAYVLITGGISLLLLGGFYWVFDILGVRRGTWLCILYGRFALASYMFWNLFGKYFQQASAGILGPLESMVLPAIYHPIFNMCGTLFLSTSLLWLWSVSRQPRNS